MYDLSRKVSTFIEKWFRFEIPHWLQVHFNLALRYFGIFG